MKRFTAGLLCLITVVILTAPAQAAKDSITVAASTENAALHISLAQAVPGEAIYTMPMTGGRRSNNSDRKARVGKGLLISGIACLAVGVPLAIIGVSRLNTIANDPYSTDTGVGPAFMTVGGVALSAVGIGLTIPGAIIYSKNR